MVEYNVVVRSLKDLLVVGAHMKQIVGSLLFNSASFLLSVTPGKLYLL